MTIKQFYPTQGPVLNLNYISNKKLDPRITFTRASTATYVDTGGLIQTAAANEARIDHDPVTGASLGLLLEEERTNLLTQSSALHTWFTSFSPIITANATSAPDGTITATSLVPASGQSNQIFQPNSDNKKSLSVFAKANGYDHIILVAQSAPTTSAGVLFNLTGDGSVVATNYGATGSIQKLANGWYRCIMTRSSTDAATMNTFIIRAADSSTPSGSYWSQSSFLGDGTSGVYIWGAQHEDGSFPTSYIPTSGSTETRAAETATLSNAGIFDIQDYTILNSPFGCAGGGSPLSLIGPYVKNVLVYDQNLTGSQTAALNKVSDDYWRWRVKGSTFALPAFTTDGEVEVDWGDGTVETLTTSEHTFSDGGGYHEIGFKLLSGTYFYPKINDNADHDQKIEAVGPCPDSMSVNLQQAYYGCNNLKTFDPPLNITGTTLYYAFAHCTGLTSFPYVDLGNVNQLTLAWYNNISMAAFPKLDTSNVAGFNYAWYNNTSLTEFPLIDTSSGTDFTGAWYNCSGLTSFPSIDTSAATTFSSTWRGCSGLTSFPFLNTSSVTDMGLAWFGCTTLTSFPLIDTSNVTSVASAWYNNFSLTSFPLINTSNVTNFSNTWYKNTSLTSFPLIDTSAGTRFDFTWRQCTGLTSFPLLDTSSGTNFQETWRDCDFTSFPTLNTSSGTNFIRTWFGCNQLTSFPTLNTSSGTDFEGCWQNCSALTSFPLIDTSSGTNFYQTWRGCGFTSFPSINTSAGTNFGYAWYGNNSLTTFPANFFNSWTGTPVNDCFLNAWLGCNSLTATSVENILNSINTSGQSAPASGVDITIDYNAGSGTPNITTAVTNLKSRGWTITLNGVAQ